MPAHDLADVNRWIAFRESRIGGSVGTIRMRQSTKVYKKRKLGDGVGDPILEEGYGSLSTRGDLMKVGDGAQEIQLPYLSFSTTVFVFRPGGISEKWEENWKFSPHNISSRRRCSTFDQVISFKSGRRRTGNSTPMMTVRRIFQLPNIG